MRSSRVAETGQIAPLLLSLVSSAGKLGEDAGPPSVGIQPARDREQGVADRLAVEPLAV